MIDNGSNNLFSDNLNPNAAISRWKKSDLDRFSTRCFSLHLSNIKPMSTKCCFTASSQVTPFEWLMKSSKNDRTKCLKSVKQLDTAKLNTAGTFLIPSAETTYSNVPKCVVKAVLCRSFSAINIWKKPAVKSILLKHLLPPVLYKTSSTLGIYDSTATVTSFN